MFLFQKKNILLLISFLMFFVTFFRLSFLNSSLYLAFIPAIVGVLIYFSKKKGIGIIIDKRNIYIAISFILLFIYCIILDIFQPILTFKSSFSLRIFLILLLSFFPAYSIYYLSLRNNKYNLDFIIKISCILQVILFFLMFFNNNIKIYLYNLFGLGDTNLSTFNLSTRGFGLSGEINFMTPFLMILITFLFFKKEVILKIFITLTQIVNSNMAVLAIIISYILGKSRVFVKGLTLLFFALLFSYIDDDFVKEYVPRLYEEYYVHGGERTLNILLDGHIFWVNNIDILSFLFGFQINVATNVGLNDRTSDMGWVIMINYGGIILIMLFMMFIISLSFSIFKNKLYVVIWIVIALIFNTKGMIIGMNGYFFLSFLLFLSKRFYLTDESIE